jgi:hypothetical protein
MWTFVKNVQIGAGMLVCIDRCDRTVSIKDEHVSTVEYRFQLRPVYFGFAKSDWLCVERTVMASDDKSADDLLPGAMSEMRDKLREVAQALDKAPTP